MKFLTKTELKNLTHKEILKLWDTSAKFAEEDVLPIKTEINKIKEQFHLFDARKHNSNLAGNIMKEYVLLDSKKYAESLIIPLLKEYDKQFNYVQNFNYLLNPTFSPHLKQTHK